MNNSIKELEISIENSLSEKIRNSFKSPGSKSFANVEKHLEGQVKYHERLMKPLQMNPKLKRAATAVKSPEKLFEEPRPDTQELGLSKLMDKVKEIAKISKHHRKLVKDEAKKPETVEEDILASKLSSKTYQYVQLARVATEPDYKVSSMSAPEAREQSNAERQALQRERNNKIASQMSQTKIIPKQLNTNVHFRHAKRKILVLRTFDSLPNRRETLKELMEEVEKKKEGLETPALMRVQSFNFPVASPPASKKLAHAKTMNTVENPKIKKLQIQNFLANSTVSITEVSPRTQNHLRADTVSSEEFFENEGGHLISELPCPPKKHNLKIPSLAQVGSLNLDTSIFGQKSTPRSILLTNKNGRQIEEECQQYLKEYYPSDKKEFLNILDDESLLLKGGFSSRSGEKNKRPEYTAPKTSKALKTELMLNLREDCIKVEDRFLLLKSKKRNMNRKINSTNHVRIGSSTKGYQVIQPSSYKPAKNLRGRGVDDQQKNLVVNNKNNSEANQTIRNLIEKSYVGEKGSFVNQEDTQTILQSYGFQDTIGTILKPKNNSKFSILEGYQREYLKGEIAKVQRHIDASLRKSQKSLVIP